MPESESEFDFSISEIVQYALPGYSAPSSISFSPDDRTIAYLHNSDSSMYRKVFKFDAVRSKNELVFGPPDGGGIDEDNLLAEEKLRRERTRERGLGVTRYEWSARGKNLILVALPSGVTRLLGRSVCPSCSPKSITGYDLIDEMSMVGKS